LEANLANLLALGYGTDVTITTADQQTLRAHKSILMARSPVFHALLSDANRWHESASGSIDMPRFGTSTVQAFLVWVYTGKLPEWKQALPVARSIGLEDASPAVSKLYAKERESKERGSGGMTHAERARAARAKKNTAAPVSLTLESPDS
jgi:hypothetical protein